MKSCLTIRPGRVLAVKLGSNPNSSSLGVDVTLLLAGGLVVGLASLLGGTLARWARFRKRDKHVD
jgi:hypothetical protein